MTRPIGILLVMVTVIGSVVGGVAAVPAGAARSFGDDPVDQVIAAADTYKACGLTKNMLAALMLAPTFPETGAPPTQSPSPMTLSRYDNQSGLHSFGDASTYVDAFWHPGVGVWQFDSAGAWGMTAAQRIDIASAADAAASVMATRWCANPSNSYVWGPWFGCGAGTCQAIYDSLYYAPGDSLVGIDRDTAVSLTGGMVSRTCTVSSPAITTSCQYVDPAAAEGYAGFAVPGFGPAPITDAFYVFAYGGKEYRFWLADDTGYAVDISAVRPLGSNARTSLIWSSTRALCDETTGNGSCSFSASFAFGKTTDLKLVGDWDGDGIDTPGVYRGRTFYLTNTIGSTEAEIQIVYGIVGDTPVVGDWDGDGTDTVGVRRGNQYLLRNSNTPGAADITYAYGKGTDTPVTGDWDGDQVDTAGVRRGNAYYLQNQHEGGQADLTFGYGTGGDLPITGDWDVDGDGTAGVFRAGVFLLRNTNDTGTAEITVQLGSAGAQPVAGRWSSFPAYGIGTVDGNFWRLESLG